MKIQEIINNIFENPLMNITIYGGLILMVVGLIMFKFPPKNINSFYGYRTTNSMKNQKRWDFAQKYSAKEMIKLGIVLMMTTTIGFITNFENLTNMFIGLGLMILTIIILIFRVENAIKIKFAVE
ncbi:MAG TPA: SdpI family protein [Edaphocola sp.]|nr:SdpI family protein [Edaphocola sp.]